MGYIGPAGSVRAWLPCFSARVHQCVAGVVHAVVYLILVGVFVKHIVKAYVSSYCRCFGSGRQDAAQLLELEIFPSRRVCLGVSRVSQGLEYTIATEGLRPACRSIGGR